MINSYPLSITDSIFPTFNSFSFNNSQDISKQSLNKYRVANHPCGSKRGSINVSNNPNFNYITNFGINLKDRKKMKGIINTSKDSLSKNSFDLTNAFLSTRLYQNTLKIDKFVGRRYSQERYKDNTSRFVKFNKMFNNLIF